MSGNEVKARSKPEFAPIIQVKPNHYFLFQSLANEGKSASVIESKRPEFTFDEKSLRDAAAHEVSLMILATEKPSSHPSSGTETEKQKTETETINAAQPSSSIPIPIPGSSSPPLPSPLPLLKSSPTSSSPPNPSSPSLIGGDTVCPEGSMKRKRKCMSAEEKAQISRDRNREHAKNTRLRKKVYVLKVKALIEQLVHIKEVEGHERKALEDRIIYNGRARIENVRLFLEYRSKQLRDKCVWAQVATDRVCFTTPLPPYCFFREAATVGENGLRTRVGFDALIQDNIFFGLMQKEWSIGSEKWINHVLRGKYSTNTSAEYPSFSYYFNKNDDVTFAGKLMLVTVLVSVQYFPSEIIFSQKFMMQIKFDDQNLITNVEFCFDVAVGNQNRNTLDKNQVFMNSIHQLLDGVQGLDLQDVKVSTITPFNIIGSDLNLSSMIVGTIPENEDCSPFGDTFLGPIEKLEQMFVEIRSGFPASRVFEMVNAAGERARLYYLQLLPKVIMTQTFGDAREKISWASLKVIKLQ